MIIRPAVAEDQAYISATWWRSCLGHNRARRHRHRINAQIDRVLDDNTSRALVTVEGDRIGGWIVFATAPTMRVLHYLYVREEHRNRGLARRLIEAAWPGKDERRMVLTFRGPDASKLTNATFVPVEDFLAS